ncbi:MAG TPA: hypothetical protein ENK43_15570 [Planctomycetes bacterium]|nr:hypothetical protein [Planctomycetota bacterium]
MKSADRCMRKASEAFSKRKLGKAWELYGKAVDAYRAETPARPERMLLALYTRVLLAMREGLDVPVDEDLEAARGLLADATFPEAGRFRGLFCFLEGVRAHLQGDLAAGKAACGEARRILVDHGRNHDLYEVAREEMRGAARAGDPKRFAAAAREALDRSEHPLQVVETKTAMADYHAAMGDRAQELELLEQAAAKAFEAKLKQPLWDLEARIRTLKQAVD